MELENLSKKEAPEVTLVADPDIALIEQIHNEFNSAGDLLLDEAKKIIQACAVINEHKTKRLEAIGFIVSKEVIEAKKVLKKKKISQKLAETIEYYKIKYPLFKFITQERLDEICDKYGLIHGNITQYTGFVPDKNLKVIEAFHIDIQDARFVTQHNGTYYTYKPVKRNELEGIIKHAVEQKIEKENIYNWLSEKGITPDFVLRIAAPQKDFNISEEYEIKGNAILARPVPDPVVFVPVIEGYLIITAWGKESEDPIVQNEIGN